MEMTIHQLKGDCGINMKLGVSFWKSASYFVSFLVGQFA